MRGWAPKPQAGLGGIKAALLLGHDVELPDDILTALRKAQRLDPAMRLDWVETLVSEIGRSLSAHRQHPMTGDHLRTAQRDTASLYAVLTTAVNALDAIPTAYDVRPDAALGVTGVRQG